MKICLIDNMASHYRKGIYTLMDKHYDIAWRFGEPLDGIKEMETSLLKDVKHLKTVRSFISGAYSLKGMCKLIDDYDFVIMIGEPALLSTWTLLLRYRLFHPHKKVFFWTHGWYGKESFIKTFVKKIYFKLATGVITYGDYARNLMIKEGFKPDRLWAIHNSLDYDEQIKIRESLSISDIYKSHFGNDNKTLIFIGRLTPVKRLDLLLEALSILKKQGYRYNLVLVGNGEMKDSLESYVKEKDLSDNVWFYGACYDERKNAELIYNADLCVAPGNVGLTAMHVMTFGTPVATHNNFPYQMPEFEAIKDGETGFFFEQENPQGIADGIIKWFSLHKDRNIIRKACMNEIDSQWNPHFQMKVLGNILGNR